MKRFILIIIALFLLWANQFGKEESSIDQLDQTQSSAMKDFNAVSSQHAVQVHFRD